MIFIFTSMAFAKVSHINYDLKFGIFGTIGSLNTKLTKSKRRYTIDTKMQISGLAKTLLGSHSGRYISKGHISRGMMVSDLYQMIERYDDVVISQEYSINHKRKRVTKRFRKWKNGKLIKETSRNLGFYAKDDLLTVYFNLDKAISKKGKTYIFKVVGLEKQSGRVKITVPSPSQTAPYKKDLGDSADWYAKALIYQKNFRKKKGDILLSVGKDGIIQNAVIKDILMYGDARVERVK